MPVYMQSKYMNFVGDILGKIWVILGLGKDSIDMSLKSKTYYNWWTKVDQN